MIDSDKSIEIKMSSVPPNPEQLSLKLSEVLEDIGVNDKMIQKRRQAALFQEYVYAIQGWDGDADLTIFYFGSQSEGTTTIEMNSDEDMIIMRDAWIVIDDLSNWQKGKKNLLMVQDETTAPGYCLLQLLRDDEPLPDECCPGDKFCKDDKGRVLFKHTTKVPDDDPKEFDIINKETHGPAITLYAEGMSKDLVYTLYCSKWPVEASKWLSRENEDGWPSASLKLQCETSGCFLVPVDNKISGLAGKGIEWRISTALAERYLMFSLNTTHLKCYVILKLLLKENDVFHDVISSYMCKTALLHCVENTKGDYWQDKNLIPCFIKLLRELYHNILDLKRPHFIIPENNLMEGRISRLQQQKILEVLYQFIESEGTMLQKVQIDNLGYRLREKLNLNLPVPCPDIMSRIETQRSISGSLSLEKAQHVIFGFYKTLIMYICRPPQNTIQNNGASNEIGHCHVITIINHLKQKYREICNLYHNFDSTKRTAARRVTSLMRTTIGTLMASYTILTQRPMASFSILNQTVFGKNTTLEWLESGLNSDVSSSMLKLATVYYSLGYMSATVDILTRVDQRYDRNVVMPVCGCHVPELDGKEGFNKAAEKRNVTKFRHIVSYCVMFMHYENAIVPSELEQEMERFSEEELQGGFSLIDDWMHLAVIDSLPYLYFLQYKTYSSLKQNKDKLNALEQLENVVKKEPLLSHKETVYNLLGQCMEQENRPNDALKYYQQSLQIRSKHNAANIYISRLKR